MYISYSSLITIILDMFSDTIILSKTKWLNSLLLIDRNTYGYNTKNI